MISRCIEEKGVYKFNLTMAKQVGGEGLARAFGGVDIDPDSAAESSVGLFVYAPALWVATKYGKRLIQILGTAWTHLVNCTPKEIDEGNPEKICNNLLKVPLGDQVDVFMRLVKCLRENRKGFSCWNIRQYHSRDVVKRYFK